MDWLDAHPLIARYDEEGLILLAGGATIGRGPDFRSALAALIANDRAKSKGIPTKRGRLADAHSASGAMT